MESKTLWLTPSNINAELHSSLVLWRGTVRTRMIWIQLLRQHLVEVKAERDQHVCVVKSE